MRKLYFTLLSLASISAFGQEFQKTIGTTGSDKPYSVSISTDNEIIVTSGTNASGTEHLMVTRLDSNGTVIWNKEYKSPTNGSYITNGSISTEPKGVSKFNSDGSAYLFGMDMVLKIDKNGVESWTKSTTYYMSGRSVQLSNGNILTTSGTAMVAPSGDTVWTNDYSAATCYSFSPMVMFTQICETSSGYLAVGGAGEYGMAAKMTLAGDTVWTSGNFTPSGPSGSPTGITELVDGSIIVSGSNADIYKMNSGGVPQWSGSISDGGNVHIKNVLKALDGGFFITGTTDGQGSGANDFFLIKMDANGSQVWARTFGGTLNDELSDAQLDSTDNIVLVGQTLNFNASNNDILVMRVGQDASQYECPNSSTANFNVSTSAASIGCHGFSSNGSVNVSYSTSSSNASNITLDNDYLMCNYITLSTDEIDSEDEVLYPNPTSDIVYLKDNSNVNYIIFNVVGKVVGRGVTNGIIDLSDKVEGVYLIKIGNKVHRIIKE